MGSGLRLIKPDKDWDIGKVSTCWFCKKIFINVRQCGKCGFYRCTHCNKCACHLNEQEKVEQERKYQLKKSSKDLKPLTNFI